MVVAEVLVEVEVPSGEVLLPAVFSLERVGRPHLPPPCPSLPLGAAPAVGELLARAALNTRAASAQSRNTVATRNAHSRHPASSSTWNKYLDVGVVQKLLLIIITI